MKTRAAPSEVAASGLVALGVYFSARPVGDLFSATPWRPPLLAALLVVFIVGAMTRRWVGVRYAPLATAVALGAFFWAWSGVPLQELPGVWAAHVRDAASVIRSSPPPAPATPGVAFTLTAAFALVAWLADLVIVTWRRAALGGLVLAIPFLVAVANSSAPLPWPYAASVGACWLALLLLTPPGLDPGQGRPATPRFAPAALVIGLGALVGAIVLGTALPRMPAHYFADGLGRGGASQVGYSPSPSFLNNLTNDDRTPVLRFRTDDPTPPPLRVAVASSFVDGRWIPDPVAAPFSSRPALPTPLGLDSSTATTRREFSVTDTRLEAPYIAAPAPVIAGSVEGSDWAADAVSSDLRVERRPDSYSLTYLEVDPRGHDVQGALTEEELRVVGPDLRLGLRTPAPAREEDFDGVFQAANEATEQVAGEGPYERAIAIQDWLRDPERFSYSLTLPDAPTDTQNPAELFDWFMRERVGYCVQFSTAMVLMARAQGIPARIATGFLPGRPVGTDREVIAADAHAWPELYFSGLGWVRFEPTPAVRTGAVPQHTASGVDAPTSSATGPEDTATSSAPATRPDRDPEAALNDPGAEDGQRAATGRRVPPPLAIALVIALGVALLPGLAWRIRRRRYRRARAVGDAALAEAYWSDLLERLDDLRRAPPPSLTPRAARTWITEACLLSPEADDALRTLAEAVEAGRYAPSAPPWDEARAKAGNRLILRETKRFVSLGHRLGALLAPGVARRTLRLSRQ